ncbi:MAG: DNA mismatch repair endonuclease MutL, partial [Gemmatimonadetes bacterium]|nr:DNA mismatch repair endonuclease MutL [Gemmatimonadota bacterium]
RKVRILPDTVANQIAAGEVVERPASVVKELVENALDAGARSVRIELRNGGKTYIRVADDGEGMSRPDALLALDRHATSKISTAEDLQGIASFGFRGEALPSIAAVSRFELETAPADGGSGTRIRVTGGRIVSSEEIARQPGTTVTVRSLFQNVPARAKFLRAAGAETRAASEAILLLALSNLPAAFHLASNGRELLSLPPADSPAGRVADIWGADESGHLLELDEEIDGVRVGGLIQRPDAARQTGGRRYLFVNGRPFRDRALVRAVDDAYRTTVAPGLRPTFLIYLGLPGERVDVNVHPAKAEVRFSDAGRVHGAVAGAVRSRLGAVSSAPGFSSGGAPSGPESALAGRPPRVSADGVPRVAEPDPAEAEPAGEESEPPQLAFFVSRSGADEAAGHARVPSETGGTPPLGAVGRAVSPHAWQLHDSYILVSTRDGMLIVDQHSAHERVLFEEIMEKFRGSGAESQRLLFPLTLRLAPAEFAAVEELGGLLRAVGFEVDAFGDRTVIVHAAPNPHPYFDAEACFRDMVAELTHGSDLVNSARNQHERIAKSMACKGAIKAGQPLSRAEMEELVDRLFATELPSHDVHGRPTILRLTMEELARRFGRS